MFVDIILPLAIQPLTYSVPNELMGEVQVGCRVAVQLGKRKLYAGIVQHIHESKPLAYEVKDILSLIDSKPLVSARQLNFWQWIADYYLCTIGEVLTAVLPSGLKMESETKLLFIQNPENYGDLSDSERYLLATLEAKRSLTVDELAKKVDKKNILSPLQSLLNKGLISADEHLRNSYKTKAELYIQLHPDIATEDKLNDTLLQLKRAKNQEALLLDYLAQCGELDFNNPSLVAKKELLKENPAYQTALKACIDKRILQQVQVEGSRLAKIDEASKPNPTLSPAQQVALDEIKRHFQTKDTVLLHGITSSGKTELYIHLIEEQLQQGRQVLYLLPEIALTVQLLTRLQQVFGDRVGMYHSRYNDSERSELFQTLNQRYDVILGARSSIFLPFNNLGLVIVDEEHETSYKQQDPAPRYHARDTATMLAIQHGAKVLLGSATPSIETYYNASTGKYGLVQLNERYNNAELPIIETVNMLTARKKQQVVSHFSRQLLDEMSERIASKEQIILFQNRRGFSPFIQCNSCGHIPQCAYCNVSLTYHKQVSRLSCHYCGFTTPMPHACTACGSTDIETKGFGTEKVEEELSYILKDARIRRLDLDAVRAKNAYEQTIASFENGETDILVGTQMVVKGLDFENVSLVGILNADSMLNMPDFRAHERSFQLMTQVCGRAGRRQKQGKALIQTSTPSHPIIRYVVRNNYDEMYQSQLAERREFGYPPFYRLVNITLKHREAATVNAAAAELANRLRLTFGKCVLGPQAPLINRIQSRYISLIMVKLERGTAINEAKRVLKGCIEKILAEPRYKSVTVQPNVDP